MTGGMVGQKAETFYTTLDGSGNGSVQFTARKSSVLTTVVRVTVQMDVTSSGVVELHRNGGFMTSMPVAPRMQAGGEQPLYCSEYLTVKVVSGPSSTQVKVTFFWVERPTNP